MTSLCLDCSAINLSREDFTKHLHPRGDAGRIRYGTMAALRRSSSYCALCRLILHVIKHDFERGKSLLNEKQEWEAGWHSSYEGFGAFGYSARSLRENLESVILPGLKVWDPSHHVIDRCKNRIQLVDSMDTDIPLRGRMLRSTPDVDMIRQWIAKCNEEHGPKCKHANPIPRARCDNLLCIDVQEKSLATIDSTIDYIALSYVWGPRNEPQTRVENFNQFCKPGALALINLPRTISDSIAVTESLGYRYLWVDSLCIVQDLQEEKIEMINQMDAVYGNANLTLIGASGENVQHGLSGWYVNQGQHRNLNIETIGPGLRVGVLPNLQHDLQKSCHAKRGWTYQETYLSRRCLVFFEGFVSFYCRTSVWREDLMTEVDDLVPFSNHIFGINSSLNPQARFAKAVEQYSSRQLSYESDYQYAFTGIQSALTSLMGMTKIWFGMPASAFDWAILWQNADMTPIISLIRRTDSPSWSWMGHKGQIKMDTSYFGEVYCRAEFDREWLRQRTWIDWHIVYAGHIVPVWDPVRDDTTILPDIDVLREEGNREDSRPMSSPRRRRRRRRPRRGQRLRQSVDSNDSGGESSGPEHPELAASHNLMESPDRTRPRTDSDSASQGSQTSYDHHHPHRDDVQASNYSDSPGDTYSNTARSPVQQHSSTSSGRSDWDDSAPSIASSDDDAPFPQYGIPELSNPYGRELDHPAFSFLEEFKPPRESSSFLGSLPYTDFPCLYFSTILCSYYLDFVTYGENSHVSDGNIILKDRDNIGCGTVHLDATFEPSAPGILREVDVLILSWTPPGIMESAFLPRYEGLNGSQGASDVPITDEEYEINSDSYSSDEYDSAGAAPKWNRFNVLLVRKLGDSSRYERIGTGELFTGALTASVKRAEWTDIILL